MTPIEVRRSGTHLFHEVSVSQLITGSGGGPAQWKEVNDKIRFLVTFIDYVENVACIIDVLVPAQLGEIPNASVREHERVPTAAHRPRHRDGLAISTETCHSFVRNKTYLDR